MLDGAGLASTAKHTPDLIDMDVVRRAGRIIENFEYFLDGLTSLDIDIRGKHTMTFEVSKDVGESIMYYKYSDD